MEVCVQLVRMRRSQDIDFLAECTNNLKPDWQSRGREAARDRNSRESLQAGKEQIGLTGRDRTILTVKMD